MTTVRRVYLYLIAYVSLLMLANGLAGVGRAAIVSAPAERLAMSAALAAIGLPVWLLHWLLAQRSARGKDSQPTAHRPGDFGAGDGGAGSATERGTNAERTATLRRLYVYAVLASMLIAGGRAAQGGIAAALRLALPTTALPEVLPPGAGGPAGAPPFLPTPVRPDTTLALLSVPWLVVAVVIWLYHRQVAGQDRRLAGEDGASATLRRWYVYGAAFIGLVLLLAFAADALSLGWQALTGSNLDARGIAGACASALVGLAIWLGHWGVGGASVGSGRSRETGLQDARSTLRFVYLFLALAVCVGTALVGASELLFYGLGRALGLPDPGAFGTDWRSAISMPASLVLVFGAGWLYQRLVLRHEGLETARQVGLRRLYTALVALAGLALLATGAVGLLFVLADVVTGATHASELWLRHDVSFYGTMLAVGLPVWVMHWRRAPRPDERRALARRLYVYVTLLGSMLTLIGAAAAAVYQLFRLALGELTLAGIAVQLGRDLGIALVALALALYHFRVLRADGLAAKGEPTPDVLPRLPATAGVNPSDLIASPESAENALAPLARTDSRGTSAAGLIARPEPRTGQITCPACAELSPDRARFCWSCGTRLRFDAGIALG